jgi:hypothetical protein
MKNDASGHPCIFQESAVSKSDSSAAAFNFGNYSFCGDNFLVDCQESGTT